MPVSGVVWPAASRLAAWALGNADAVAAHDSVLELGCGCGLVGLAALAAGARSVVFTDADPSAIDSVAAALGELPPDRAAAATLAVLDWTTLHADVFAALSPTTPPPSNYWTPARVAAAHAAAAAGHHTPPPLPTLLLGADVLYDRRLFEPLLGVVALHLHAAPASAVFVTAYHLRSVTRTLAPLLDAFHLTATVLPLPSTVAVTAPGSVAAVADADAEIVLLALRAQAK